jgi:1,4-alpha-glucan branching enzyme
MASSNHNGYLCLVLQAHLPYIRHPEYEYFLEENWLYEAITETYIPLLDVFSRLVHDNIDFRLTLSLSPSLVEMLSDDLLRNRYARHLERLIELSEREIFRTKGDIHFEPVARMYHKRFLKSQFLYHDVFRRDLVSAFGKLQDSGNLEIITSAATHAFLPVLSVCPEAVKAQIRIGSDLYEKHFGRKTKGIWLPECGFYPGLDNLIREEDIHFIFLETHGLIHAKPAPQYGVYAPIACPSGVAAFGRDSETSQQVWSSHAGYPGDPDYRDFYRDIGYDLDLDYMQSYLQPYGTRSFTGLKYHKITGKTQNKQPYILQKAMEKAAEHASHFIMNRVQQVQYLSGTLKRRPVISAIYDAELFGHWWFEGPEWIEQLFRGMHHSPRVNFKTATPSEYLGTEAAGIENLQACEPSASSWGNRGYHEVWLNEDNDYVYRHVLKAAERMIKLAER